MAIVLAASFLVTPLTTGSIVADSFTYIDDAGQRQTVEGILAGSGQGLHAPHEVELQLIEEFGADGIRTQVDGSYVVALVLAGPLPSRSETRVAGFLTKMSGFLQNVERVVTRFCRDLRIDAERPKYPLVTLIFETDRDFNAYVGRTSGEGGLSAEGILGFYSPVTNWLAIRFAECRTYQVPLHEAVHQQVANRGLIQRLAGVPVWFNEGIATGFENNGERINIGPNKVNATYARRVSGTRTLSWEEIVKNDAAFRGDVLAGEAYAHAWSLHWLLVTEHRTNYVRYLQKLGQIKPLEEPTPEERANLFRETFGVSVAELEQEFPRMLQAAVRKQRVRLEAEPSPGQSVTFADAGRVQINAVQRAAGGGWVEVHGQLRNVSPFRDFAYHVTVQTTGGLYADWFLPLVGSLQTVPLDEQYIMKRVPGGPGVHSDAYWVEVSCALPDSDIVAAWKENGLPAPEWKPR
jgi:hypothetical protein